MARVVGIVGSYRKGGVTAAAVEAVLEGARESGAETQTFFLSEKHLEFCTNCRDCTQKAGPERGTCRREDDMEQMVQAIEAADGVVLGSAVNYGSVTALFRMFMERLTVFSYWPWGQPLPKLRKHSSRKAVLVASAGMPRPLIPWFTEVVSPLRWAAKQLGAKPVGHLWLGPHAWQPHCRLSAPDVEHARRLGRKLAR
jgi:NAD(P)H-dependent FMN reductase